MFRLEELIGEVGFYLRKKQIREPVTAFTGNSYHLLFPLPAIKVEEQPDIGDRLKQFRDIIHDEVSGQMRAEGIKLDSTVDLRRVAKIYGTKKPCKGARLSKFYGSERIEDFVLREYLLSVDLTEPVFDGVSLTISDTLPAKCQNLLRTDSYIQKLWNNEAKAAMADVSRTGCDLSLIKECINKGITDINDLVTILALRPE